MISVYICSILRDQWSPTRCWISYWLTVLTNAHHSPPKTSVPFLCFFDTTFTHNVEDNNLMCEIPYPPHRFMYSLSTFLGVGWHTRSVKTLVQDNGCEPTLEEAFDDSMVSTISVIGPHALQLCTYLYMCVLMLVFPHWVCSIAMILASIFLNRCLDAFPYRHSWVGIYPLNVSAWLWVISRQSPVTLYTLPLCPIYRQSRLLYRQSTSNALKLCWRV